MTSRIPWTRASFPRRPVRQTNTGAPPTPTSRSPRGSAGSRRSRRSWSRRHRDGHRHRRTWCGLLDVAHGHHRRGLGVHRVHARPDLEGAQNSMARFAVGRRTTSNSRSESAGSALSSRSPSSSASAWGSTVCRPITWPRPSTITSSRVMRPSSTPSSACSLSSRSPS